MEPLEINFMVGQAFAIAAASYFPLLFMSVWWRGMTMKGAATGMLTGGLCALVSATIVNVSTLALDKGPMGKLFAGFAGINDFWVAHPLLRILAEQPAIWSVPLSIGLMIVVSKATRKTIPCRRPDENARAPRARSTRSQTGIHPGASGRGALMQKSPC